MDAGACIRRFGLVLVRDSRTNLGAVANDDGSMLMRARASIRVRSVGLFRGILECRTLEPN